jgi:hypothetical protein
VSLALVLVFLGDGSLLLEVVVAERFAGFDPKILVTSSTSSSFFCEGFLAASVEKRG